MKRFASLTLLLAVLLGSAACATLTPDASMKSWMEKPVQGAILAWGPPTRTITDGADGQVMEWSYWQPAVFIPYVGNVWSGATGSPPCSFRTSGTSETTGRRAASTSARMARSTPTAGRASERPRYRASALPPVPEAQARDRVPESQGTER